MAQLDDKTLKNLNKRLEDMDRLLATDYQKAMDLGKAFTQGFTTEQIDAFLKKLNTISRKDAAKLNVALNLVDVNGRPLTLSEVKRRISQIENAINKGQTSTSIRGTRIVGTTAMTNELQRYKDALSILGMSTSQQFDLIRNGVSRVNRETKGVKSNLENLLPTLRRLAGAFGVAFSVQGLVNFGRKLVETRGEFELQQVAMRSILQNKQLADEIWDKTMQAALQSPFTAMQLTKYTKQLAAYRIETDKLFDTTKRLADVSAGLGVDMQRLILAYGQVKAANYLRASEIRQFTEAGVNVLGELRDYFNDVKGMSVDTAKVMDMVQKRLVTFSDVEAIFKRMTDQGGIFYNMQYVQSQTVKGQINKLHDAYDQMLNSIGKANEGAIKNMVSLLNNIVKNWREWKTVLDTIAWPLIITSVIKLSRGLTTTAASAVVANKNMGMLVRTGAKLQLMLKNINPWMALATAVTAATFALINHVKAVRATQKEIDEQNLRLYETKELMSGYQKTLEENNKAIKEGKLSEDELNKKRKENSGIIAKLKEEYPDIVRGLDLERDGTDKLTESLKNYNDELDRRMTLTNLLGTGGGWFSDTVRDNMQQWENDLSQLKGELISMQSVARQGLMKLHLEGKDDDPLAALLGEITSLDLSNVVKASEKYEGILQQIKDLMPYTGNVTGIGVGRAVLPEYLKDLVATTTFPHDIKQVSREQNAEFDRFITNLENEFDKTISSFSDYSKKIADEYNGDVSRFIADNTGLINKGVKDGSADMVKNIRIVLQTAGIGLTEESRTFYNNLLNARFRYLAVQEQLNKQEHLSLSEMLRIYKQYEEIDFFATPLSLTTGGTGGSDTDGKGKSEAQKMISLLKEMNSEYTKLSKSAYGFAKSNDKVRESFEKAFAEVFKVRGGKGTYIDYNKIDITSKAGLANALQSLYDELAKTNSFAKFGKTFEQELLKAIGTAKVEADIEVKARIREDFGRQMEEAFGNYELTLELQKLNIPEDAVKDLFPDFDYTSIGALQDIMEKFYNDRQKKDEKGNVLFSKDDLDAYKKWSAKIDSEILKMRKEKAQQYSRYLEKEYSERAKVEMKYAKDVAFVTANVSDDAQRKNILSNLQKKYQDDINELNWKSFKESDFYVEMMEDITSLPKEYTQMMLDKINEILQHPETLSPRALKEAINARQKVLEAQMNLEPLDVMRTSVAQIRTAISDVGGTSWKDTKEKIHEQVTATQEQINELEEEARCWDETAAKMQVYEDAVESVSVARGKLGSSTTKKLEEEGSSLESVLKEYKNLRNGFDEERQQLLIDFKKENLTDEEDAIRKQLIDKGYLSESGELTPNGKDRLNYLERQNSYYQEQIDLLDELIGKEKELQSIREGQAGTDAEQQRGVGGVGTAANARARAQEARDEASEPRKRIQSLKDYLKAFTNFNESFGKFNAAINSTLNAVQGMGNAFYDMFDALGGETDALTDGWKEFGNTMITQITQTLTMIPMMVAAFTAAGIAINSALGIIGLIAEALQLLFVAIGAIAKLHDSRYDKEIENQQKEIDALKDAYARLERQIERTWSSVSYMQTYEQQVQNIREQIDATEAQLAAARQQKGADTTEGREKIRGYENALVDLYDQLEDNEQKMREVFGGIGEEGYRSAAEGFVEAWKSAFLETGDGLQGLQDHFDEFLQDWFTKQATMLIARKYLDTMFDQIDAAVNKNGRGGVEVAWDEIQDIMDTATAQLPAFSAELEEFFRRFGGFGEGSLSGLAAGIQGMTEEQANILEAYWNSVRMYTASIDTNVSRIAEMLGAGGPNTNPMLTELETIASHTSYIPQIYTLLTGTRRNLGNGQGFVTYNQ